MVWALDCYTRALEHMNEKRVRMAIKAFEEARAWLDAAKAKGENNG